MATTVSVSCSEWTKLLWTSVMPTKKENPGETVHWLLCECYVKLTNSGEEPVKHNLCCVSGQIQSVIMLKLAYTVRKCIVFTINRITSQDPNEHNVFLPG